MSLEIFLLEAPYIRLSPICTLSSLPIGSVVVARNAGGCEYCFLTRELRCVLREAPTAIVLASSPSPGEQSEADLSALHTAGIDDWVSPEASLEEVVAVARRAAGVLDGNLTLRLELLIGRISLPMRSAFAALLQASPFRWVSEWAWTQAIEERTLQVDCIRWSAPSPKRFLELRLVLEIVRSLQQHPDWSVERALGEAGCMRPQTGRDLVKKLCGIPASEARKPMGLYWILERWVRLYWAGARVLPSSSQKSEPRVRGQSG